METLTDKQIKFLLGEIRDFLINNVPEIKSCPEFRELGKKNNIRKPNRIFAETNYLSPVNKSFFQLIVSRYCIKVSIWIDNDGGFVAQPGLGYINHTMGSNGNDMNFVIIGKVGDPSSKFTSRS